MILIYCDCCKLEVPQKDWDMLYSMCHQCAFCASLEHFPCDHGGCLKHVEPEQEMLERRLDLAMRRQQDPEVNPDGNDPIWLHYYEACQRLLKAIGGLKVATC